MKLASDMSLGSIWGKTAPTLPNGLIHYWNLDEASGGRSDSVGDLHLTDNSAVASAAGIIGNSAVFAGNDYLSRANVVLTPDDGSLTISMWIYFNDAGADRRCHFLDMTNVWNTNMQVSVYNASISTTSLAILVGDGAGGTSGASYGPNRAGLAAQTWHHILSWYDSSDRKTYISVNGSTPINNGVSQFEISTNAMAGATRSMTAAPLWIGRGLQVGYTFGRIDEIGVWSRVLSTDEKIELYNSGVGKFPPFTR
jgi:hypothetical protein